MFSKRKTTTALLLGASSVALVACGTTVSSSTTTTAASTATTQAATSGGAIKTGLKVFVIPKVLGNSYFTTADSVQSGGALAALQSLGEVGTETSGTASTPSSQLPVIQSAITQGANALVISATDPTALCPTLNQAMAKGITVVTYDSDAPTCRDLFVNQASTAQIGTSEVDLLAKQINATGEIAIVSATASATNQNAWIGYMKQELTKYPNMHLVSLVRNSLSKWSEVLFHRSEDLFSRLMPSKRKRILIPGFSPFCNCHNELLF